MNRAPQVLAQLSLFLLVFSFAGVLTAQDEAPDHDVVKLTNGQELVGTIVKAHSEYIWIDTGAGDPVFLAPDEIKSLVQTESTLARFKELNADEPYLIEPWDHESGVTRAAVLSAEGMVGLHMRAEPLREAIPMLKEEGVDLVVIKINSGGGLYQEITKLSDVLHNEYKPEFQVVMWVDSAISAAAMVAFSIEHMYFMSSGWFGQPEESRWLFEGVDFADPEVVVREMEMIGSRGNHASQIVNAVMFQQQLSYDIDEEYGYAVFYQNLTGEHVLNDGSGQLLLNAVQAEHCGFSGGTVDTHLGLQALLTQHIGTIEWVGREYEGYDYPVCKAEQHQIRHRSFTDLADAKFSERLTKYRMEIDYAKSVELERRDGFLRRAEANLSHIKRAVELDPYVALLYLSDDWLEAQEEIIRELREE